jgi:hypothetical protein
MLVSSPVQHARVPANAAIFSISPNGWSLSFLWFLCVCVAIPFVLLPPGLLLLVSGVVPLNWKPLEK